MLLSQSSLCMYICMSVMLEMEHRAFAKSYTLCCFWNLFIGFIETRFPKSLRCPGWDWPCDPPDSASQNTGIAGRCAPPCPAMRVSSLLYVYLVFLAGQGLQGIELRTSSLPGRHCAMELNLQPPYLVLRVSTNHMVCNLTCKSHQSTETPSIRTPSHPTSQLHWFVSTSPSVYLTASVGWSQKFYMYISDIYIKDQ